MSKVTTLVSIGNKKSAINVKIGKIYATLPILLCFCFAASVTCVAQNYSNSTITWSVFTTSPGATKMRLIVPSISEATSFSIFIAS